MKLLKSLMLQAASFNKHVERERRANIEAGFKRAKEIKHDKKEQLRAKCKLTSECVCIDNPCPLLFLRNELFL